MTTKECIEQVKTLIDSKTGIRGLLDWDNEALQTLISLAEQVEGVRGIESPCPYETSGISMQQAIENSVICQRDLQWRTLIVRRFLNLEEKMSLLLEGRSLFGGKQKEEAAKDIATAIRNLFLGGGK